MADMIPQGTQEGDASALGGYERSDANVRAIVWTMVVILTSCVVVVALLIPMFAAFQAREARRTADLPALFAVRQVPPEPRLLPSPIDNGDTNLSLGLPSMGQGTGGTNGTGVKSPERQQNTGGSAAENANYTSDNQLPWDKLLNEAAIEQAQHDSYTRDPKSGRVTIPVDRALDLVAGPAPATTSNAGQHAGSTTPAGAHAESANETTGEQTGEAQAGGTRDMPAYYGPVITESAQWETPDQKYTADSSGGLNLDRSETNR